MITVALEPRQLDNTLDPAKIAFTSEFHLLENLTIRLFSIDERGELELKLASNLIKRSALEYDIQIKDSFYCNGDKITLEDVKSTIERAMKKGSSHTQLSDIIKSVSVSENYLKIVLKKVSKSFFYFLSMPDLGILHSKVVNKPEIVASDYIGYASGPYCYESKADEFYLSRNKFDKNNPSAPQRIKLVSPFNKDIGLMVLKDEVDLGQVGYLSFFKHEKELLNNKKIKYLGVPSDALTYLFFNKKSKKYSDKNRRKEIYEAFHSLVLPKGYNQFIRRAHQYFPLESKAYSEKLDLKILSDINSSNERKLEETLVIHTYTTAFNVTLEPVVRAMESMSGLNVKILNTVAPKDLSAKLASGEIDVFLNIMSSDLRMPLESINYEYFSPDNHLVDIGNTIKRYYSEYENTFNPTEEKDILEKISFEMLAHYQVIPLFYNAIPFFYNSSRIDTDGLSHLYILNFDKLKIR